MRQHNCKLIIKKHLLLYSVITDYFHEINISYITSLPYGVCTCAVFEEVCRTGYKSGHEVYGIFANSNMIWMRQKHVGAFLSVLTLNIPRGVLWGPKRVIFCDPAVTISTNLLLIFVCVPYQLKINIMYE